MSETEQFTGKWDYKWDGDLNTGEWVAMRGSYEVGRFDSHLEARDICNVMNIHEQDCAQRHEGDAMLIAQLVEALESIVDSADLHTNEAPACECGMGDQLGAVAQGALAAARGPAEAGKALLERLRRYEKALQDIEGTAVVNGVYFNIAADALKEQDDE
jgi:hypothetical protein